MPDHLSDTGDKPMKTFKNKTILKSTWKWTGGDVLKYFDAS